jgi:hypothetical protein
VSTLNLEYKETEYLVFREQPAPKLKTRMWSVESKLHGDILGLIRWFGRWRQYVFEPAGGTLFNVSCLSDIEQFLDTVMFDWRAAKQQNKQVDSTATG